MSADGTHVSFADYDVVGFDLDHTLCKYRLPALYDLVHDGLAAFLVKQKNYPEHAFDTFAEGRDFVQKGLVIDKERGNFLKISADYRILRASHGTRPMSRDETSDVYGEDAAWKPLADFPLVLADASASSRPFAAFKDFFVVPVVWICAKIVDDLDGRDGGPPAAYDFWQDVYDGLIYMYNREAFGARTGPYFPALEENPQRYIEPCSDSVRNWLKKLHESKKTFLLTSSHVDYASFLARHCLGSSWAKFFDVVFTFARKPGFFTCDRPFLRLHGDAEGPRVPENELKPGTIYSQGNWQQAQGLFARLVGKKNPRVAYLGDSLIDDVYVPSAHAGWDAVAVVEEMSGEGMLGVDALHESSAELRSHFWGSFFCDDVSDSRPGSERVRTVWHDIICRYSRIAVPHVEALASLPVDAKFTCFTEESDTAGYYPAAPTSLR